MWTAASPRGWPSTAETSCSALGWVEWYACAAPVTDETVAFTPAGLQTGAAAADGATAIPKAIPPSRQPALAPATRRRTTIVLNFMLICFLRFELIQCRFH